MAWEQVRAAMIRQGDRLPTGTVAEVEHLGALLRVVITVDEGDSEGEYTRGFDDIVSRRVEV